MTRWSCPHWGDDDAIECGAAMVEPVLEMREVSKRYPGVLAVNRVSVTVLAGEVHVIAGENGAGKSTLMKLLAQIERPDDGVVLLDGTPVEFRGPRFAAAGAGRVDGASGDGARPAPDCGGEPVPGR